MGVFEHFPWTDYHEKNLDWLLKSMKQLKKDMEEYDLHIEDIVDQWLTGHPEATTTVQDNSLTLPKFTDSLKLVTVKDYLTPQMYGAVGDGTTDDSAAIQAALNAAQAQKKPVALISNYYCNANLTVPSYVRVFGLSQNTERTPYIFAGTSVTTLFDMPGIINRFDNFGVANASSAYRNNVMFDFHGNASYDIDSVMYNVQVGYAGKGVICRGRNLEIDGCLFSHCEYGVYYYLPSAQMRGLTIKNSSFHGIGEEAALNYFESGACIYIESDYNTNLLIENNHSEQSGTFFKGRCTQALIVGNFIESYKADVIIITASPNNILGNTGCMLFACNMINGKRGEVAPGINVNYPKHLVTAVNNGRVAFIGNVFRMSGEETIVVDTMTRCSFSNNAFVAVGMDDNTKAYAFKITQLNYSQIMDNVALDSSITLYPASATGRIKIKNNAGFTMPTTSSGIIFLHDQKIYAVGTTTGGAPVTSFTIPDHAVIRRSGYNELYVIDKLDGVYSGATVTTAANKWCSLYVDVTGDDPIIYLREYTIAGDGTVSSTLYTSTLVVYQVVND